MSCSQPKESYARIYFPPKNIFRDLGLEIRFHNDEPSVFANIYSCPIVSKDSSQISIEITMGEQREEVIGYLFEGGQKIAFSKEIGRKIINQLLASEIIQIKIGPYCSQFTPDQFKENYDKLWMRNTIPLKEFFL